MYKSAENENKDNQEEENLKRLDIFLGKKLRDFRERVGWTLTELGERVGVSHQQIHKYERADSKISAAMLFKFAQLFETNPNAFFDGFTSTLDLLKDDMISLKQKDIINILLIEDSSADEFLIRKALENCGHQFNFYCLHDSDEVFNFLRRKISIAPFPRPDIILLDLNLPKVNGLSILKSLKQDREIQDIPIIVLTSSLNKMDMINAYKNHASGFISKSFDFNVFQKNLQTTINYWVEAVVLPSATTEHHNQAAQGS